MWSSSVRKAIMQWLVVSGCKTTGRAGFVWPLTTDHWPLFLSNYFRGNSLGGECLNHVADFDVAVVGDRDAAFHAVSDLAGIVLEAPQRSHLALEHLHVVAQQTDFGVALDQAIIDAAAGHGPNFRDAENVEHVVAALV